MPSAFAIAEEPFAGEAPHRAGIRPLAAGDLAAVAALFRKTFKPKRGTVPLESYLQEIFLEHPWREPGLSSLVFVRPDGGIGGFIGVLPVRLSFNGVVVRGASAGSLMVERPEENPLAGARLLRSFLNGPQEISLSDSANELSQRMWEKVGGKTAGGYSMEWLRVFDPAAFAVAVGREEFSALGLARPFAAAIDAIANRVGRSALRLDDGETRGRDASEAEIIDLLPRFAEAYPLRPAWDRESLAWFLAHAAEKDRYGPLVRRVVTGRKDSIEGIACYSVRPRGIAFVLQVLAVESAREAVVDDLLADAKRRGAVAVRGRVQPEFSDVLLRRRSLFLHAASTVFQTRRADLASAIASGQALITGLAGESWSRLIGGAFL
jgi:hypothetical protein